MRRNLNNISERIEFLLEQSGMTKVQFAQELGLTRGGVDYMLKHDSVKATELEKMARILDTSVEFFYGGKPKLYLEDRLDDLESRADSVESSIDLLRKEIKALQQKEKVK